ncbi:carbohydrate ABC transporter permease [Kroppenstedtia eburnea]|uniref:L-arabinose ABC transporter membrane protein n=1 Tax=Kroppenstedtia eburnea TaxID=714067 RepID=A0A1N7L911_9BACL|nr:sugar ABC transporter permease [Kroppenstedtia eburnea]EGK07438.1 L-arabinose transport system permease AraP [Desmospora sp. 8437]QKI81465.1 sugar ABC transporter permease [Kroppenstedtia eburnea]SIS70342.1 L-arabinose ABC transporter membrane protein [Kroppenstedtia eburnea]
MIPSPQQRWSVRRGNIKHLLFSQKSVPYLFIVPFLISFVLFFLYPIAKSILMSFQEILPGERNFVGWDNYARLLNEHFYTALYNTVLYTIWTLIILIPVPLVLAVILNSKLTFARNFFKSALFIPSLTSTIVAGVIFRLMFGEQDSSLVNSILLQLGWSPVQWTQNAYTAMFLMVTIAAWKWIGINILYFMAALQSIPRDLYEAAAIDGAGSWTRFTRITLPLVKPIMIYVITISIIGGFRMFEESYVFWGTASPGDIGLTLAVYLYQQGFEYFDLGFGATIGLIMLIITLIFNLVQWKYFGLFKKEED